MDTETSPFLTKTPKEDMTLIVEGKKIYVIKGILALYSPVFENMLCAERYTPDPAGEIELEGDSYGDWLELLQFLYPTTNMGKTVTSTNVEGLLPLCDKYQVDFVKDKCHQFLKDSMTKGTPVKELRKTMFLADRYHLKDLKAHCEKLIMSKRPSELLKRKADDDFEDVLLRKAIMRLESELDKRNKEVSRLQRNNRALEAQITGEADEEILEPYIEECPTCGGRTNILENSIHLIRLTTIQFCGGGVCTSPLTPAERGLQ